MIATTTLLIAAASVAVIGSAVSAYGMYAQGQAQKKMGDYNAKVQQQNAAMKIQQAQYSSMLLAQRNQRLRGSQAANAGKSGIDISGSTGDVMYDSALQGSLDQQTAIYKGEVGSNESISAGNISQAEGAAGQYSSYFGAAGSILGGVGAAAGYAGRMKPGAQDGYPVMSDG